MRKFIFLLLFTWVTAMSTFAGGYQVGLHSIRNIGMGLIGTSLTYDASSLFYNPGASPFVNEKFSISGGVTFLMSRATFQAKDEAYQEHVNHVMNYPLYFYASYKPIKDLCIGIAVNTPYGLSMSWPDNWEGRYLIQNVTFKSISIQPTVAYKIKDIIGIGAGLIISYGDVNLKRAIPVNGPDSTDGQLTVKGSTIKYGFNAGILVHPVKGLNIGIDYRSKIDMSIKDGDATFAVPTSLASNFTYNKVDVSLPLPANLDLGISYEINEKIMIGLDLNYVFWSTYDSLTFTFKSPDAKVPNLISTGKKLYKDRLITRLGVQWKVNGLLTVRAGGYYDPSPVPTDYLDPMLPSSDETALTCGFSLYPFKRFSIDASFEYLMGKKRSGISSPNDTPAGSHNFEGTYSTAFYMPGIGLTYNF